MRSVRCFIMLVLSLCSAGLVASTAPVFISQGVDDLPRTRPERGSLPVYAGQWLLRGPTALQALPQHGLVVLSASGGAVTDVDYWVVDEAGAIVAHWQGTEPASWCVEPGAARIAYRLADRVVVRDCRTAAVEAVYRIDAERPRDCRIAAWSADGDLIVIDRHHAVSCLDAAGGGLRWQTSLPPTVKRRILRHVALDEEAGVGRVTLDAGVWSFALADGDDLGWRALQRLSKPDRSLCDGRRLWWHRSAPKEDAQHAGSIEVVDLASGEAIAWWTIPAEGGTDFVDWAVAGDVLVVATRQGNGALRKKNLSAYDWRSGRVRWRRNDVDVRWLRSGAQVLGRGDDFWYLDADKGERRYLFASLVDAHALHRSPTPQVDASGTVYRYDDKKPDQVLCRQPLDGSTEQIRIPVPLSNQRHVVPGGEGLMLERRWQPDRIRCWDIASRAQRWEHAFDDGEDLVGAGRDAWVTKWAQDCRIRSYGDGGVLKTLPLQGRHRLSVTEDRVFISYGDGRLQEWSLQGGVLLQDWPSVDGEVTVYGRCGDGDLIIHDRRQVSRLDDAGVVWRFPWTGSLAAVLCADGHLALIRGTRVLLVDASNGKEMMDRDIGAHAIASAALVGAEAVLALSDGSVARVADQGLGVLRWDYDAPAAFARVHLRTRPGMGRWYAALRWMRRGMVIDLARLRSGQPWRSLGAGRLLAIDDAGNALIERHGLVRRSDGSDSFRSGSATSLVDQPGRPLVGLITVGRGSESPRLQTFGAAAMEPILFTDEEPHWLSAVGRDRGLLTIGRSKDGRQSIRQWRWQDESLQPEHEWLLLWSSGSFGMDPDRQRLLAAEADGTGTSFDLRTGARRQVRLIGEDFTCAEVLAVAGLSDGGWALVTRGGPMPEEHCAWRHRLWVLEADGRPRAVRALQVAPFGGDLQLVVDPAGKWVLLDQVCYRGGLQWFSTADASLLAECRFWRDRHWSVACPDGRWDGSLPADDRRIRWSVGDGATAPFAQAAAQRRPGLLGELLGAGDGDAAASDE